MDDDNHHTRGGLARSEIFSPERSERDRPEGGTRKLGRSSSRLRRCNLEIGDAVIPCAVLDTKQRVLTQSGVMKALGL